jgi:hypothetical protein
MQLAPITQLLVADGNETKPKTNTNKNVTNEQLLPLLKWMQKKLATKPLN